MGRQKRKQIVVDKGFQFRLVSTFLFSILAALLIFSVIVAGYFWVSSMAGENVFREFITVDKQVMEKQTVTEDGVEKTIKVPTTKTIVGLKRWELVLPAIMVNNLVLLVVVLIIGIRYSHRIAGPLFRITSDIQRVLDGDSHVRIKLRTGDRLQELSGQLNQLIARYDELRKPE